MMNLRQYFTSRNVYYAFLHFALFVLAIQVVVLSGQNRQLKQPRVSTRPASIAAGDSLTLSGLVATNRIARWDSTAASRIVFVFTAHCPFCKQTMPIWNRIVRETKHSQAVTYIGICLDSEEQTKNFMAEQKPEFPVFTAAEGEDFIKRNKLYGVPQTIITSAKGTVRRVWRGLLSREKGIQVTREILDSAFDHNEPYNKAGGKP